MPRPQRRHTVVVGNIGTVVDSDQKGAYTVARKAFEEYRQQSRDNYGRAAGEDVTWFMEGEPYYNFFGNNHRFD
jgi:hypothetical protein